MIEGYPTPKVAIVYAKEAVIKNEFCFPVVVDVLNQTFDVPAKSEKGLRSQSWGEWHWMPGVRSDVSTKKGFYPLKNKITVDYGPDTPPTHVKENKYGYDFFTPEKTPVYAIAAGTVIRAISHFNLSHQDLKRLGETNSVEVLHSDGTVARYSHLYPGSLKVKNCQRVNVGEELGLSGNTGYSKVPHLHLDVFKPTSGTTYETLPLELSVSPP